MKRKLPEKKDKCNICGRMFVNMKGLDIHRKRMHIRQTSEHSIPLSKTDSVRSSKSGQSVKSPPPKKLINDTKAEEIHYQMILNQ